MTNMVTMPKFGKNPLNNILLHNQKADELGTWCVALRMQGIQSLFKVDNVLLASRSNAT